MSRLLLILAVMSPWLAAIGQTNITGIWISKSSAYMGETEIVFDFKTDAGRVYGNVSLPYRDLPIVDGKITGDSIEFTLSTDYFGQERRLGAKGILDGDMLRLAMPGLGGQEGMGRSWGRAGGPDVGRFAGRPPGVRPFEPGGQPQGSARIGTPGGVVREIVACRGNPSSQRRKSIDYKSLPKISLPKVNDLPPNGLAQTPPMGWTSKYKYRVRIDDKAIREIADAMVATGMRDAGYSYINIDDGWQGERDAHGVLQANSRFPDMKNLADYVHSKGFKLGIYSSPAPQTYGGFEGSYGHEEQDAKEWSDWGIDYLKYDWCAAWRVFTNTNEMRLAYQKMAEALRATQRPIVYGICQYGRDQVWQWGSKAGGNLWRTTIDINDNWFAMGRAGFSQTSLADLSGPGQWNDPDILEIGNGGMNDTECRAQISLWAILAAPLFASNDPRKMYIYIKDIPLNREVIAVDQDKLGKQGRRLSRDGDKEIWCRPLENGDLAVGLFNRGEIETEIAVRWADLNRTPPLMVRDLWKHSDRLSESDSFVAKVPVHGVVMLRVGNNLKR